MGGSVDSKFTFIQLKAVGIYTFVTFMGFFYVTFLSYVFEILYGCDALKKLSLFYFGYEFAEMPFYLLANGRP